MSLQTVGGAAQGRLGAVVVKQMKLEPPSLISGDVIVLILAVGLGGFGVWLEAGGSVGAGRVCFALAVPLAGLAVFGLTRSKAYGSALTLHERGVVISRKGSDEVIPYLQVRDFSLKEEELLGNGMHTGVMRTLDFEWSGGSIRIAHITGANVEDAFAPILAEILGKLADAAEARLQKGAALEGKGWKLDSHGLHVDGQAPMRLDKLAGVATFERKISFWRPGEELPFLSIPEASPNARLLSALAWRQGAGRERPLAGSLGRILLQKTPGTAGKVLYGLGAVCCILGAPATLFVCVTKLSWNEGGIVGTLLLGGFGVACVARVIHRFRVYELGVTGRSLFGGERTLRYSEITSFQYGATRHYHNGGYTGTAVSMRFSSGPGGKNISHGQTMRGNDSDLDALREHVAKIVAGHLLERLKRGEVIHWGPSARFTRNGLVVQAPKLFGKGEERLAPYNAGLRISIQQGTLHLFIGNESKSAMSCPCAADNFYPGLKMFSVLVSQAESTPRAVR